MQIAITKSVAMSQFAYANSFTADGIPSAAAALASPMFPLMPLVDNTVYDTLVADLLALPKQQGVVDNQVPPDSVFSLLDGSGRLVAFKVLSITTRYGFGFSNNAIKGRTLPIPGAVGTDDTKMLTGAPAVNVWSPLTPIMPSGDTDDLPSVIYDMSVPERSAFGGMPTWVSKCSRPSPVSVNSIACDWYLPWAPWTDANRTNWRKFAPLSVSSIGPITGVYFSFTAIVDAVFEQGNPLFVVASHARVTSGSNKISLAAISDDPATIIQTVYPQDLSPSSRTMGGNLVQSPSQAGPVFVSSDQNIDCALNGIASPLKCEHSSVLYASLTNFAEEVAVIKKPNQ